MTRTMRAVVLDRPGGVEHLQVVERPVPEPPLGWVLIKVEAFGLNRSELHTRLGLAEGVTFPRVLGIEAVGTIEADPGGLLPRGTQVATMMGGMGRTFDGGYAEYTVVPASQVILFRSELPWEVIGAVPETLQTAHGSLSVGLDLDPGQSLLIRGGTSALGLTTATLARERGATVLSTTRDPDRVQVLAEHGVHHPLVDDSRIAAQVRELFPRGVDAALELVGTPTLPDTLRATAVHGTVCFTGMLSNQWTVPDFYPIDYLPRGVRLTAYSGEAGDLPADVLQHHLDDIAAGVTTSGPLHVYALDDIRKAHDDLEHGRHVGKLVVRCGSE
ncbi:zinc-binding dehydrogenase [Streptomyces zaomyceticus]|uniref:zinc-binding dehydrogenase n=1 Tax=Streptomyces zaomyceticus TaxID=68286 RepID=UPI0019C03699|nr:zinc-binding dehydrogenase [Streptomyces zaomyceticus]GHG36961.1 NADPH:quinone reductase [Streptomyces zaomyceticus]